MFGLSDIDAGISSTEARIETETEIEIEIGAETHRSPTFVLECHLPRPTENTIR